MGYIYTVVTSEIVSIIISVILAYGNLYETRRNTEKTPKKTRLYSFLVITNIIGLFVDMFSWILDGNMEHQALLSLFNYLSLIGTYVLLGEFALYMGSIIQERSLVKHQVFMLYHYGSLVAITVTTVMYKAGLFFDVIDGYYEESSWYTFYSTVNAIFIIALLIIINIFRKVLGTHDIIAICIYIMIPVISSLISIQIPEISLGYTASTISLLVAYVMLQAENANKLVSEKNESSYIARHDELTDLLSRRVYVDKLEALAKEDDENVGVFFADVNGLKYANDRFGHIAGDKLLVQFADIAKKVFKDEEVFRISGDEFVMLLPGVSKNTLLRKTVELESQLVVDGNILACFGVEYGSCKRIFELVRMAENQMYAKKDEFYLLHPEMKR